MSDTLGMPGLLPSNAVGMSGISAENVGKMSSGGVLGTIQEGRGALSTDSFYYPRDVAYYQLPSVQRSHGDDNRSIQVKNFGARGSVTLTKRNYNFGPSYLRLQLPIRYAWAGCEYTLKSYMASSNRFPATIYSGSGVAAVGGTFGAAFPPGLFNGLSDYVRFVEVCGCDPLLPTSFQSEGFGFACPQTIEIELGGAGRITIDRYSNFAAIMASTPFKRTRKDLMRMAGGGLDLWDDKETAQAPVVWGWVTGYNAAGNSQSIQTSAVSIEDQVTTTSSVVPIRRYVPIQWDVLVPIKTPDTNFYYALSRRKPLDTTILAGDLQYTFTWSNFYEWSDTGTGYPNAPCYLPQRTTLEECFARKSNGVVNALPTLTNDFDYAGPYLTGGASAIILNGQTPSSAWSTLTGQNALSNDIGSPFFRLDLAASIADPSAETTSTNLTKSQIVQRNPVVWTNHYRVAAGRPLNEQDNMLDVDRFYSGTHGDVQSTVYTGRPRYPQLRRFHTQFLAGQDTCVSQQPAADHVNNPAIKISYPTGFDFVEFINSSLKLTNPSLGGYSKLRQVPEAVAFYPFQYMFSQIIRVNDSPFKNLLHITRTDIESNTNLLTENLLNDQTKISKMIQMPANPCTSLLVMIMREKDRQFLGKNTANTYSPVLFWNALKVRKMNLWDGGNILFRYNNVIDYDYYSLMDRPDPLVVPYKGGLVKVDNRATYMSGSLSCFGAAWDSAINYPSSKLVGFTGEDLVFGKILFNGKSKVVSTAIDDFPCGWLYGCGGTNLNVPVEAASATCAFPMDDLCCSGLMDPLSKKHRPCHLTCDYESTIYEFCFVMNEPFAHEKYVQTTPSFARTQLKLEFWIDPKMMPDNGMDDQYKNTYGLTRAVASGLGTSKEAPLGPYGTTYAYPGPSSHPVPDCLRLGCNPTDPDLTIRDSILSAATSSGITTDLIAGHYANGYSFATKGDSWNINNGDLMIHLTFCQNQVWCLSPIKTTSLSSRG